MSGATRRLKRARRRQAQNLAVEGWQRLPEVMYCEAPGDGIGGICNGRIEAGFPSPRGGWLTICPGCGVQRKVRERVFGEHVLDSVSDGARGVQGAFLAAFARVFGGGR